MNYVFISNNCRIKALSTPQQTKAILSFGYVATSFSTLIVLNFQRILSFHLLPWPLFLLMQYYDIDYFDQY